MRQVVFFSNDEEVRLPSQLEYFSVAEDLKNGRKPIRTRFRLLIQDYSRYVVSKKSSITKEDLKLLDQLFIQKVNGIINDCEESIKKGLNLSVQLGATDKDLKKSALKFTKEYRKLLKSRDSLHYIPREIQLKVDEAYKLMIADFRKLVFKPVLNLFSIDPAEPPKEATSEQLDALHNHYPTLAQLREYIIGALRKENIDAEVEIEDNKVIIIRHEADQDQG